MSKFLYNFFLHYCSFQWAESVENVEKEIKTISKTYKRNRLNTSVPASSPKKTALNKRVMLNIFFSNIWYGMEKYNIF